MRPPDKEQGPGLDNRSPQNIAATTTQEEYTRRTERRLARIEQVRINMPISQYEEAESERTPRWVARHRSRWLRRAS